VETPAAADALRQLGCDGAQGWHFARPLSATLATQWLADHLVAVASTAFTEEDVRVLAAVGGQEAESERA